MERLHLEIKALTNQLRHLVRAIRQKPIRGTVAAAARNNFTFQRTMSETSAASDFATDGGSAAASLGFIQNSSTAAAPAAPNAPTSPKENNTLMSGDNNGSVRNLDRGDGAITLPDMLQLSYGRWEKLFRDFYKPKTKSYDVSKIPDIYDSAKYDIIHNRELLDLVPKHLHLVYHLSRCLADVVVPQEYGQTRLDKFRLGSKLANKLAHKIETDLNDAIAEERAEAVDHHRLDPRFARELGIKSVDRHVLTRVYFTSESHMHSLLNILRFAHCASSGLASPSDSALQDLDKMEELDYLCHIVLRLFEVSQVDGTKKCIVKVAFSPGVNVDAPFDEKTKTITRVEVGCEAAPAPTMTASQMRRNANQQQQVTQLPPATPLISLWNDIPLMDFCKILQSAQ